MCDVDANVLFNDFVIYSAYLDRRARGVSVLVKRSLDAMVDLVYVGADGRLIVSVIAVSSSSFRVVAVYAPKDHGESVDFFHQLGLVLVDCRA